MPYTRSSEFLSHSSVTFEHSSSSPVCSQCSAAESQVSAQRDQLATTTSSLVSQLQQTAQEVQQTLEESSGYCSHLHSSLGGLGERSLQWCSSTREQAQSQAQEQLTLLKDNTASTHTLLEVITLWN